MIDFVWEVAENVTTADGAVITASQMLERFLFPPAAQSTFVGRLSGGERQRVALARALLKRPRVLVLDEATSALDPLTERAVLERLYRAMEGRTLVVIAHRLSSVRGADRICVLDGGRIVEEGTHESLLARGGLYRDLYEERDGGGRATAEA